MDNGFKKDKKGEDAMETTDVVENLSMEDILKEEETIIRDDMKAGEIILVKVAAITAESILVDVGMKVEGIIPKNEFKPGYLADLKVGDSIPVFLQKIQSRDGSPKVSYKKAYETSVWEKIIKAYKEGTPLEGKIVSRVKGGMLVDIGIDAFMPSSQLDIRPVRNPDEWIGQTIECIATEINKRKNNIVVSRRRIEEKKKQVIKDELLARTTIGDIVQGTITGITKFGAFVDIGGIDGLLHIGNISWYRIKRIEDVLHVGDTVKVRILSIEDNGNKISLGKKQLEPHPWDGVEERFPIGTIMEGKVSSVTNFGVFVELENGIEGLVHASEMSWKNKSINPKKIFSHGRAIKVKILSVDRKLEKISLSVKRTEQSPWEVAQGLYKPGSTITGEVSHLAPFGAFIMLPLGIEGLAHINDMSWIKKIKHPQDVVKIGQQICTVVLDVNGKEEKIALGIKQLSEDPYKKYSMGKYVEGKVKRLMGFGALVELEAGIDAFIHVSEMLAQDEDPANRKKSRIGHPSEVLRVGEYVKAKIIKVNRDERKIDLSIKKYEKEIEKKEMRKYMNTENRLTLGDLLDQNDD